MMRQAAEEMKRTDRNDDDFDPSVVKYSEKLGWGKFQEKEKKMIKNLLHMSSRL